MRRGAKPGKAKVEAKRPVSRKARKGTSVRQLQKRLAEALNREAEAFEQQTATAEILRVMSSSLAQLQPVLDAIAERAARLCDASNGTIILSDGEALRMEAHYGPLADQIGIRLPIDRKSVSGRAFIEGHPLHVDDLSEAADFPLGKQIAARFGIRTFLAVPLVREAVPIGLITMQRTEVRPFSDKQIELLKTFADQAVIAIENVRLFTELQTRNSDLAEAFDQQTATSEILRVISSSPTNVTPIFQVIVEHARRLCDGVFANVVRLDGGLMHNMAHHGFSPEAEALLRQRFPTPPSQGMSGRAILTRAVVHAEDANSDAELGMSHDLAQMEGFRSMVSVPMLQGGTPLGAITVARRRAGRFPERQVQMLRAFADEAVIAIENVRLFTELGASNRHLTEALEQQTATSEILRVISRSPDDIQPVFDAIAANAARLCDAVNGLVIRFDGQLLHLAAHYNVDPERLAAVRQAYPRPPSRGALSGRAILTRTVVHVPDVSNDPDYTLPTATTIGYRSVLAVPMMHEGVARGTILVARDVMAPFSDAQIALIQTFADQAVIAIENVRLFTELQASNRELTTALDTQTATSDILRVIRSSPTDVQPVFDTIVGSAMRLLGGFSATLRQLAGDQLDLVAFSTTSESGDEALKSLSQLPLAHDPMYAQMVRDRAPCFASDTETDPRVGSRRKESARARGYRSVLIVPMLCGGSMIGAIAVTRREPGSFTDGQTTLLQTFADQAVIAIENVRLFKELEARNRDLTEALEQQTATAEILRVISSSPTNLEPVFNVIVRSALRLCGAVQGNVQQFDGELMHLAAFHVNDATHAERLQAMYPRRPDWNQSASRAVLSRAVVHIPDVLEDPEYPHDYAQAAGFRALLSVPMLREGRPVGALTLVGAAPGPFSDNQIELLKTFADQAVIAIENVRLFTELQTSNRELTTALDTQTATSDILRVISRSQTDVQPVFDAIVGSAVHLLRGHTGALTRVAGDQLELAALTSTDDAGDAAVRARFPQPLQSEEAATQAMRDRAPFNITDTQTDPGVTDTQRAAARARGFRSLVVVPLLHRDEAVGTIAVTRREPGGFTEEEIALLQTFADQAVIAIENVRLFTELEGRNRDLTATGEILRVISSSPTDVQPVFDTIVRSAVRLCGGLFSSLIQFDGELMHQVAQHNYTPEALEAAHRVYPARLTRTLMSGRAILERAVVHIPDVEIDPEFQHQALTRTIGWRSGLFVPMMREGAPIGVVTVMRAEPGPFSDSETELLKTFADQAVIAVENVRLFKELEARNRDLTEALDRQTATAEILRVISQSQTEVQPVFDAIADNALRLFRAWSLSVSRSDGQFVHPTALRGGLPGSEQYFQELLPLPVNRESLRGRCITDRTVIHVADVESDPTVNQRTRELARARGWRSTLLAPMQREGQPIGVIAITRAEAGRFSPGEIELLQTFADQAVIAIENARLLGELQARTAELTRSVGQLTALGEVGRAVSSTLDLDMVLTTIVSRAAELAGADGGSIYEYDEAGEEFALRATHNLDEQYTEQRRGIRLRKGEGATGHLAVTHEPAQVPDITVEGAYDSRLRDVLIRSGARAVLAVPLLHEDHLVGGLVVNRNAPGEFPPEVVELLRTFATQSALAIQNARLFHEIEDKSRQLEAASQHKSEFLANMSHELRTPLNAIIGFSEILAEKMFGDINEKQTEYLQDILESGRHLLSLINDILDLSKIEAGRMELELSEFDLPNAIENALILVREWANRRGIRLGSVIDERLGMIGGDERKVKQVLLNLLSNALKFTPEGGRIDVSARAHDEVVEVSVTDTGVGIAPEDREAVFEEFRQVGTADKKVEGTGLGLALSRKFIELHGGRIWVKSQVGQGSTFTFTLPVRRED